jgi:hypothetical protein
LRVLFLEVTGAPVLPGNTGTMARTTSTSEWPAQRLTLSSPFQRHFKKKELDVTK